MLVLAAAAQGDEDGSDRASVRAAELTVRARRDAISIARADWLPTVTVFFQSGVQAFPRSGFPPGRGIVSRNCSEVPAGDSTATVCTTSQNGGWFGDRSLGVNFSWPLFDGLRTKGAMNLAQAQLEVAEIALAQEREAVALEVARARAEVVRSRAVFAARRQTVDRGGRGISAREPALLAGDRHVARGVGFAAPRCSSRRPTRRAARSSCISPPPSSPAHSGARFRCPAARSSRHSRQPMHHRSIVRRALAILAVAAAVACGDEKEEQAQAAQGPNGAGGAGGAWRRWRTVGCAVDRGRRRRAARADRGERPPHRRLASDRDGRGPRAHRGRSGGRVRSRRRGRSRGAAARTVRGRRAGERARRALVASRAAAQSALSTAEWNLEQARELFKAGAVPERDVRVAEQAVASARAQLAAAEAQVRASSSETRDTRVLAPTYGVVERRFVEPGEHVARGAELFTVVRADVLELAATVPARYASQVRTGQTTRFTADARTIEGRVVRVSPTIDPATRSITVYVQVPNASGALKGGTFVSGRIVGALDSGSARHPVRGYPAEPDRDTVRVHDRRRDGGAEERADRRRR